jgi:hypothetical protein
MVFDNPTRSQWIPVLKPAFVPLHLCSKEGGIRTQRDGGQNFQNLSLLVAYHTLLSCPPAGASSGVEPSKHSTPSPVCMTESLFRLDA